MTAMGVFRLKFDNKSAFCLCPENPREAELKSHGTNVFDGRNFKAGEDSVCSPSLSRSMVKAAARLETVSRRFYALSTGSQYQRSCSHPSLEDDSFHPTTHKANLMHNLFCFVLPLGKSGGGESRVFHAGKLRSKHSIHITCSQHQLHTAPVTMDEAYFNCDLPSSTTL